ncbi:hypothetical protein AB3X91_41105 [Paraburkholderia sp. BR14263]|uniref:hypothetical protein n=1 Tax=unclassified Paraburkholderia TaxID=2615204 RepID=UPI0034D00E33
MATVRVGLARHETLVLDFGRELAAFARFDCAPQRSSNRYTNPITHPATTTNGSDAIVDVVSIDFPIRIPQVASE